MCKIKSSPTFDVVIDAAGIRCRPTGETPQAFGRVIILGAVMTQPSMDYVREMVTSMCKEADDQALLEDEIALTLQPMREMKEHAFFADRLGYPLTS